jgi:sucrose-6-phosphate hydrolase SacC (GH32 family)
VLLLRCSVLLAQQMRCPLLVLSAVATSVLLLRVVVVFADNTLCVLQNGTMVDCGPTHQTCPDPPSSGPSFHLTPRCHGGGGGNDPCAPIWDPNHRLYHIFFQDHLAAPSPTTAAHHGGGPIWGHWVSKDLVRWSRAPVALWNGLDTSAAPPRVTPYDNGAIYTGSATLVNGSIKLVYPGLCNTNATGSGCPPSTGHGRGCHLGVAVPASTEDAFLTNWSKATFNPFATNVGRDPSAAWQTPSGEWQFTTYMGDLFGTMDWIHFYQISDKVDGWGGECPSLFALPRSTPGADAAGPHRYSHVYKLSKGNRDWMILGRFTPAVLPNTSGTWQALKAPQMVDSGGLYASKDWRDAVGRRLTTGFGHCPGSAGGLTLPREITFHPALDALVFNPIPELAALRTYLQVNMSSKMVGPDEPLHVVSSNQTEITLEFALPTKATIFGVNVSGGLQFFVNFTLHNASASIYHEVAVGADIGNDHAAPAPPLRLLPTDRSISMRLFVDDAFVECYFQDGRQVITWGKMGKKPEDDGVAVTAFASEPLVVRNVKAFEMSSIWLPAAVHIE